MPDGNNGLGCAIMKIATWNVERLKHQTSLDKMISAIEAVQADILVLTETDERIKLNYRYSFHTQKLHEAPADYHMPGRYKDYAVADVYAATENRVSIYTNYPCVRQHKTYDRYTALCIELETEAGNLLVYGTIIGIIGNRDESFKQDLLQQVGDFERLSKLGDICICGDFNCSFADNYYFTNFGRETLRVSLARNKISLLTGSQQECIDHIAVSRNFIGVGNVTVTEWNLDKSLSDHKGIVAEIKLNSAARAEAFGMNLSEIGFRGLYRNFTILQLTERLKCAANDFPGAKNAEYALVYGYIDHTSGLTLEILALGNKSGDGFEFENGNNDIRSFIRVGAVKDCIFYSADNNEEYMLQYREKIEMLKGYTPSEDIEKIRDMTFLDTCRSAEYPDDVLVYLFKEGCKPEGCWVRVEKIAEPGLAGILLNEPDQNIGCHAGDMIQFGIQQLKDGTIVCFSNFD